jgi:hypothetical protein
MPGGRLTRIILGNLGPCSLIFSSVVRQMFLPSIFQGSTPFAANKQMHPRFLPSQIPGLASDQDRRACISCGSSHSGRRLACSQAGCATKSRPVPSAARHATLQYASSSFRPYHNSHTADGESDRNRKGGSNERMSCRNVEVKILIRHPPFTPPACKGDYEMLSHLSPTKCTHTSSQVGVFSLPPFGHWEFGLGPNSFLIHSMHDLLSSGVLKRLTQGTSKQGYLARIRET